MSIPANTPTAAPAPKAEAKPRTRPTLPDQGLAALLVGDEDAAALCGIGASLWWSLVDQGKAPAAVKLGSRTLWRVADINKFVESLKK